MTETMFDLEKHSEHTPPCVLAHACIPSWNMQSISFVVF